MNSLIKRLILHISKLIFVFYKFFKANFIILWILQEEIEIELRTSILLGIKDLKNYIGKKMSKDEIIEEKKHNIEIATQENKL